MINTSVLPTHLAAVDASGPPLRPLTRSKPPGGRLPPAHSAPHPQTPSPRPVPSGTRRILGVWFLAAANRRVEGCSRTCQNVVFAERYHDPYHHYRNLLTLVMRYSLIPFYLASLASRDICRIDVLVEFFGGHVASRNDIAKLYEEFNALAKPYAKGKLQLEFPKIVDFVRDDPETALGLLMGFVNVGREDPAGFQRAAAIAAAYEVVSEDDSPRRYVERAAREAGIAAPYPTVPEPDAEEPRQYVHLVIGRQMMDSSDIYSLLKLFSLEHNKTPEARDKLRDLSRRCFLSFSDTNDPREAWLIPKVRAYVSQLHGAMRYFPYFLCADRHVAGDWFYFTCLTSLEAVDESGANLLHPSLVDAFTESVTAMESLCEALGVEPSEPIGELATSLFGNAQYGNPGI